MAAETAFALVLAAIFVAFFVAISAFLGLRGGWQDLSQHYRCRAEFCGKKWHFQDLYFYPFTGYRGCATVGADSEALYLAFMGRVFHPPLLIRWRELSVKHCERRWLWMRTRWSEFSPERAPQVRLALTARTVDRIIAKYGGEFDECRELDPTNHSLQRTGAADGPGG